MLSLSWVLSLRAQCMELLERKAKVPSRCNVFPFSGLWSYYLTSSKIVYPSLILALGNPRVDLLSLDIEGAEYLVLQTLPWEKVPFDTLSIGMTYVAGGHQGNKCGDPVCRRDNGWKQRRYPPTPHQQRIHSPWCHLQGRVINNPLVILMLI